MWALPGDVCDDCGAILCKRNIHSNLGNEHAGKPKKIRLHVSEQDAATVEMMRDARVAASTLVGDAVASERALELEG